MQLTSNFFFSLSITLSGIKWYDIPTFSINKHKVTKNTSEITAFESELNWKKFSITLVLDLLWGRSKTNAQVV